MKRKVGVIGVGNISQKAYLPIYTEYQDKFDFIISSRSLEKAERIRSQYKFSKAVEGIKGLLHEGIEIAFVHNATQAHFETCKELLNAGIHVFVDKPISQNLLEVEELQTLAKKQNKLFMTGFNRRFAPMTEQLKKIEGKNTLFLSKNRVNDEHTTDWVIYDLFIHPLDTAFYLLDDEVVRVKSSIVEKAGKLQRAMIHLETATTTAIVSMNLKAGANQETFEVQAGGGTYRVENLNRLTSFENGKTAVTEFDDWTPTLEKRGFSPMVKTFLQAVDTFEEEENSSLEMFEKILRQEKVHQSHELCEQMLRTHIRHQL
ncbi:MAG: Gfo/Idh/MocA family oxidoreductase [Lactobacillales bacterium]|jgi:virulence factor|nr:Gfo/Idh/MocA family oxidoreductase [Lactobacillales bacterium]